MTRNRAHKADRDVWTSGVLTKVLQAPSDQFSQKMICKQQEGHRFTERPSNNNLLQRDEAEKLAAAAEEKSEAEDKDEDTPRKQSKTNNRIQIFPSTRHSTSNLPPVPRTHDFSENVLLVAVPASSSSSAFVISRRSLVVFYLVEASWSLDPNKLMIQAAAVPLLLMSCNCNNCVMKIQTFQNYNENLAPSNAANCF